MNQMHWTQQELKEYFTGYMPPDEAEELERHLQTCAKCFQEVGEMSTALLALEESSASAQRDLVAMSVSALASAEMKGDKVGKRLLQWAGHGKAWGATRLGVIGDEVTSTFESIVDALVSQALQFVPNLIDPTLYGAIETGGGSQGGDSALAQNPARVGLSFSRRGEDLVVHLEGLPSDSELLVVLVPLMPGIEPQYKMLDFDQFEQQWTANFEKVPQGDYLLLLEPPEDRNG